ncbi:MAG: low molecular weight phosphotyrosine protein phosphatase, partial [Clostridia bacterium]|nr:low molecular weight phosphotyrosine protein phosphatase [Clostridia bacterium]
MINVAFVCLGNICRSPMAELVFKNILEERGLSSSFNVSSFGTSD